MAEVTAKMIFDTVCEALTDKEVMFMKLEEENAVTFGFAGDNVPVDIALFANAHTDVLTLVSRLKFTVCEEKRIDFAVAVADLNYKMVIGSFDFNFKDGYISFRITNSYRGTNISKEVVHVMVGNAYNTVDKIAPLLSQLNNGEIQLDQLLKMI